jgi:hypothetical protein
MKIWRLSSRKRTESLKFLFHSWRVIVRSKVKRKAKRLGESEEKQGMGGSFGKKFRLY